MKMKIRNKYILTYMLTILCPILLFLGSIFSIVTNVVVKQSMENETQANEQLRDNLRYALKDYADIVNRLCYSGEMQELLGEDPEKIKKGLSSYLGQMEIIRNSILFYDYQAVPTVYLLKDSPLIDYAFFMHLKKNSAQAALYETLAAGGNPLDWRFETGKITISRPLSSYQKHPYGLVQLTIREQDLYRHFSAYDMNERYIVILDEAGRVVSSNDRGIVGADYTEEEAYRQRKENGFVYTESGEQALFYEFLGEGTDTPKWTIVTKIPVKSMRNLSDTALRTGLLTVGLCFLASSFLYLLLSGDIARRIRKLSVYMELQTENEFVRIPEQGPRDEIYRVQKAFNKMITDIEQLIHDNYVSELEIKNITIEKQSAELFALQNQMHPHFLFNTLESIRMKLQNGNPAQAQEMLVALSKILRMSLRVQEDLIPLQSELSYVGHYIKIQNLRFPERYGFTFDFSEEMLDCLVPKYAVQTLVENAVLHGIDPKGGRGRITVWGSNKGENLCISVRDDGVGIPEPRLQKIREQLEPETDKHDDVGIGIRNVNDRLILHFGNAYAILIESRINQGTEVKFHVPHHHC